MGLLDRFKPSFNKEKCERTINYDARDLKFKSFSTDIAGANFSLGNFETERQKIRDASAYAETLDDYQYQMCKICKDLGKDDVEWRKYNGLRVGTLQLLTTFRFILTAFERNPDTEKARLYEVIGRIQDYLLLLSREVMPNIEDLKSKDHISKGELPEVNPKTLSKALDIAELDESEVSQFIEDLKSSI